MIFKQLFDTETWTYTYLIADPVNIKNLYLLTPSTPILITILLYWKHRACNLNIHLKPMFMPTT